MFRMEVFSSRIRAPEAKIAGIETITVVPCIPRITDSCILKSLMKFRTFSACRLSRPLASALAALLAAPLANAAVYYWDSDSTTAGFGNVAGKPTITVNNSSDTIAAVVAGTAGMTKAIRPMDCERV